MTSDRSDELAQATDNARAPDRAQPQQVSAWRDARDQPLSPSETSPAPPTSPQASAPTEGTRPFDDRVAAVNDGSPQRAAAPDPSSPAGSESQRAGETPEGAAPARQRSRLEGAWNAEAHDVQATRQMHDYLAETAKSAGIDAKVIKETDCGASVCRVKLAFNEPGEAMRFQAAAQNPDFRIELKPNAPPLPEGATPAAPPPGATPPDSALETATPAANQPATAAQAPAIPVPQGAPVPNLKSLPLEVELLVAPQADKLDRKPAPSAAATPRSPAP
jgi:hypothetical protein